MGNTLDSITNHVVVNSKLDVFEFIDDMMPMINIFSSDINVHISHHIFNNQTYLRIMQNNELVYEKVIGKKMMGVDQV